MSWGTELWDQYDNIAQHTQKGIDFLDKYGNFIKDRCAIEVEYAAKLRRLIKNYHPKAIAKKKEEEDSEFSSQVAFRCVLKELGDFAGQREIVAENLQSDVLQGISLLSKNLRDERKKSLNDGAQLTTTLNLQIQALDRAKKNYEKAFRDSEKAIENYHKADADFNLSRAEVEKFKHTMSMKCGQSDDAKNEYANQLQKTNKLQQTFYETALPEVFNRLQELDERRTRGVKEFIKGAADVESAVASIIARCLEGILKASEAINEKGDSKKVIERFQSGFHPPGDIPFEDLSKNDVDSTISHPTPISHPTMRNTISSKNLKKRVGLFGIFGSSKNTLSTDGTKEDYSDLPPTQRRKKLVGKVQELQTKVQQEQAARDGLMKMKGVYEANSLLGDPMTVEGQLNEAEHKLEKLRSELRKYQQLLDQANSQPAQAQHSPQSNRAMHQNGTSGNGVGGGGQRTSRHSNGSNDDGEDQNDHDQRSLSSSSASPESGLGTSHTSLPGSGQGSTNEQPNDEYYDPEPLQPLGTCKALYPFDATSEGSIPMSEGEELQIIEIDQGDGWTRVRRHCANGWEEGFVPTSYIETTLYA